MAYQRGKEEHAFKRIEMDLRGDKIPSVVLLCGSESYLVRFYVDRLVKRFVEPAAAAIDFVTLEGDAVSANSIMESCETLALLSSRKVVLVPDFLPADGKSVRKLPEGEINQIMEYLPQVPETTLLLFTSGEPERGKTTKFRTAASKCGSVYDFQPLDDSQLRGFIDKRLRTSGKSYRPSVLSGLIRETGYGHKYVEYGLDHLENDLRKLTAYVTGDEITMDDVKAVITVSPENNIFSLLDSVSRNRKGDALLMLHHLLDARLDPFMIQSMIVNQLELILTTRELSEEGYSLSNIVGKTVELKLMKSRNEYRVKKALGIGQKLSVSKLRQMLSGAYGIDRNVKTGLFDPKLALEYYIANI